MLIRGGNKRGQITVFVIIGLIIIASVGTYLAIKSTTGDSNVGQEFLALETYHKTCIQEIAASGVRIMQGKGGYIKEAEFVRGNPLEPLSSRMNFLGDSVPYWLYLNNGEIVQQAPTINTMQEQLEEWITNKINECTFEEFSRQGYDIQRNIKNTEVEIKDREIIIMLAGTTIYEKNGERSVITKHETKIESDMGRMYRKAMEIYNQQLQTAFLENYTIDVIRLYAPVDGVEISCAPKIWKEQEVFDGIMEALEANIPQIRLDDGKQEGREDKYFTIKVDKGELETNFQYSKEWLTSIEIQKVDGGIMIAQPVGAQEGVGIMGFCYVPYHFVYDFDYPVMVQIIDSDGEEFFQYPLQVIIRGNQPRKAIRTNYPGIENTVCKYPIRDLKVSTYDSQTLEGVNAQISFKCLGEGCYIGESGNTGSTMKVPQCVNGFLTATAEGYENAKVQISTNNESEANILLDKKQKIRINLTYEDGQSINGQAFTYLTPEKEDKSIKTIVWPEIKEIEISEGSYNISAYVYENTNITIPSRKERQCFKVPRPGIGAFLGLTKEECLSVTIPGQKIQYALGGGGRINYYFTQSELEGAELIEIKIPRLPTPRTIQGLQTAYDLAEVKTLGLEIK
jgi:hypothetical protein